MQISFWLFTAWNFNTSRQHQQHRHLIGSKQPKWLSLTYIFVYFRSYGQAPHIFIHCSPNDTLDMRVIECTNRYRAMHINGISMAVAKTSICMYLKCVRYTFQCSCVNVRWSQSIRLKLLFQAMAFAIFGRQTPSRDPVHTNCSHDDIFAICFWYFKKRLLPNLW